MDKERFLDEVTRQLRIIFDAIREGHKPPEVLKHRCEGFMRAGVFLGVVKTPELSTLMEDLHLDVVGMTLMSGWPGTGTAIRVRRSITATMNLLPMKGLKCRYLV